MKNAHVQTKREIDRRLAESGMRPRKRFGQHFLIDGNLMRRLVTSADLRPSDTVLEVGGGTGGLTDLLVDCAGRVICVELDRDLLAILRSRFAVADNVTIMEGDVLESKHRIRSDVAEMLRSQTTGDSGEVKLVANLPYQIATPLIMNLLVDFPEVRQLCFTVQAEVGERLLAEPGGKTYGPLSIVAQTLSDVERIARLSPEVFWPRPAVESVMLSMKVKPEPFRDKAERRRFSEIVRGAFDHRRKTLRTSLGLIVSDAAMEAVSRRFDTKRRPESFGVGEWLEIVRTVASA